MVEKDGYDTGTFCWVELATDDQVEAKNFYSSLFGWEPEDDELPTGGVYTTFRQRGLAVAAAYEKGEQERDAPSHWNAYISVDDADQYAKRAEEAGGSILAPAFDVMEQGRMAVLSDPTGAVVSLWQPKEAIGARLVNEPGSFIWTDLVTNDTAKAKAFYTDVFGWETEDTEMPNANGIYTLLKNNGKSQAGMYSAPPGKDWGPPHWIVCFSVADADATVQKGTDLGGVAHLSGTDIPGVGRLANLGDPQGASFTILQSE